MRFERDESRVDKGVRLVVMVRRFFFPCDEERMVAYASDLMADVCAGRSATDEKDALVCSI